MNDPGFYGVDDGIDKGTYWISPATGFIWCIRRSLVTSVRPRYGINWRRNILPDLARTLSQIECDDVVIPKEIADLDDQMAMIKSMVSSTDDPIKYYQGFGLEALKDGFDMAIARYMIKRSEIDSVLDRVFAVVDAGRSPRIAVDVEGDQFVFVTADQAIRAQYARLASEGDFFYFCRRPRFYRKADGNLDVGNVRDESPIDDYPWCRVLRGIDWQAVDRWFDEQIVVVVRKLQ